MLEHQARRLRIASLLEGYTLLLLILVAVPMKHFFGLPLASRLVGPIHGVAFMGFIWCLCEVAASGGLRRQDVVRLLIGSCLPFGAFINRKLLQGQQATAA